MKIKIANMVWSPVVIILFNWVFGRTSRASLQIFAMRFDICGTSYKNKGGVVSKRGTEWKKKNDPPI